MDFIELKLWKAGAFVLLAFVWGVLCGMTGRELNGRKKRQ